MTSSAACSEIRKPGTRCAEALALLCCQCCAMGLCTHAWDVAYHATSCFNQSLAGTAGPQRLGRSSSGGLLPAGQWVTSSSSGVLTDLKSGTVCWLTLSQAAEPACSSPHLSDIQGDGAQVPELLVEGRKSQVPRAEEGPQQVCRKRRTAETALSYSALLATCTPCLCSCAGPAQVPGGTQVGHPVMGTHMHNTCRHAAKQGLPACSCSLRCTVQIRAAAHLSDMPCQRQGFQLHCRRQTSRAACCAP